MNRAVQGSLLLSRLPGPAVTYHSVAWRTSTLACSLLWVLVFTEIRFLGFSVNLRPSWLETLRGQRPSSLSYRRLEKARLQPRGKA